MRRVLGHPDMSYIGLGYCSFLSVARNLHGARQHTLSPFVRLEEAALNDAPLLFLEALGARHLSRL